MTLDRNHLSSEISPYLLQHKDNPVWWYPWCDEAFERARREDKPVFLSIGYSTCYWCHVMEKDSFESRDVADFLNEHFVSIKVDREELPDVDQIYMEVVLGIHGHGGWPMSVFLTPDREPFWGGTFFYRQNFLSILRAMIDAWKDDRAKVTSSSAELTRFLHSRRTQPAESPIDENVLGLAMHQLFKRFDREHGGFGEAPKFPPTQSIGFLFRAHAVRPNAAALEAAMVTLSAMGRGGLFDQIGAGFHRYSVDAEWRIPHFEKMLYDNALLASVYLEGYQLTGNQLLRVVGERTLEYIVRELGAPAGGFFAAEDAGDVGKEGEFYSWTPSEVAAVVGGSSADAVCQAYGISEQGNFEHGRTVLTVASDAEWQATEHQEIRESRARLYDERSAHRTRPHRDEKILTGWNGLAITALCRGFQVLQRPDFLESAVGAATFIEEKLVMGGRLQRRYCAGVSGIPAMLEDYAYIIEAYLELFSATGNSRWLDRAASLQREQDTLLWSGERRAYVTSSAPGLITLVCEWVDGATPSPNAVSLSNLTWLAELTGDAAFDHRARLLEQGIPAECASVPILYMATLKAVLQRRVGGVVCCVVEPCAGNHPPHDVQALWREYLPFARMVWSSAEGQLPRILEGRVPGEGRANMYVCRHATCQQPTTDREEAARQCSVTDVAFGMDAW